MCALCHLLNNYGVVKLVRSPLAMEARSTSTTIGDGLDGHFLFRRATTLFEKEESDIGPEIPWLTATEFAR